MTTENVVLVADSNREVLDQLRSVLTDLGLEAIGVADGVEALRFIDRDVPSLVVADVALAVLDGYTLCNRLRREEPTRTVPIVLMSATGDREERLAALGAGADDLIVKPLDLEDAKLRLKALLRRAQVVSGVNGNRRILSAVEEVRSSAATESVYRRVKHLVEDCLGHARKEEKVPLEPIREGARTLVGEMDGGDGIVAYAMDRTAIGDLAAHHVNVAIVGIAVGRELGLPPDLLHRLALFALVHDLGMVKVPSSLLLAPRRLNRDEFREITQHPAHTYEILRTAGDEGLADIARQEHEREKGQGYPRGLPGEEIHELAKILGVADVYEACTHPRPYRKARIPYDALQELIEMRGDFFHPRHIKALMQALTVFPTGSWVQLNTGESGRVQKTSKNNLMRPVVRVMWNAKGERLEQEKTVDLTENPYLFVNKPLSEEGLPH